MDTNQTLGNVIRTPNQGPGQSGRSEHNDLDSQHLKNTALVIFTVTMNLKYPEVDVNNISYETTRKISEFAIGAGRSFNEVWNDLVKELERPVGRQQQRAA